MTALSGLDFVFIIAYLFLVILVAYVKTRKRSEEDFLIAERKMGVFSSLCSINASKTGSILLLFTALLYAYGFSAIWYFIGVSTGYIIFIPFAIRIHKQFGKKHYTLADYFFHTYGKFSGRCASALNILIMLAWLMLNIVASSKVLSFFTGLSFEMSTVVVSVFTVIYLLMGGFKAVVTTDVLQYCAIVIIFILFAIVLVSGVTIPAADWNLGAAGITNVMGFFLIGILLPFSAPDLWQRVYAVKNKAILKKSIFYSVLIYIVVGFLLALIGLAIKAQLPGIDPDIALVQGFTQLLPVGVVGLAIVIFFAAFMSSIDTYAYTASSSLIHDFFRGLSKRKEVKLIKAAIVFFILTASLIAIAIQDLMLGGFIFAGYAIMLTIPILVTWWKPSVKATTLNTAMVLGTIGLTFIVIQETINGRLEPNVVLKAIGLSVVGLIIGSVYSLVKKIQVK